MFDKPVKTTQVTWETVQSNAAFLFFAMAVPEKIDSPLLLLCQGVLLFVTGMTPFGIKRIPLSASITCGIVMAFGCCVGCLSLAPWFPALRSVVESKWGEAVPSVSISLSAVLWIFVVLKISPATRALRIGTVFVAAAASYTLACGIQVIVDAVISDATRSFAVWEEGIAYLLNGCAMIVWARLVIRELTVPGQNRGMETATLFVGCLFAGLGIFGILLGIFS